MMRKFSCASNNGDELYVHDVKDGEPVLTFSDFNGGTSSFVIKKADMDKLIEFLQKAKR